MWRSIQLVTLYCTIVVAEEGSFLGASRRLRIHHSALSRRIRHLELMVGVALFERHPGGVKAAAAGEHLLAKIRSILTDLDEALNRVEPRGPGKSVQPSIGLDAPLCSCAFLNAVVGSMASDPEIAPFISFLRRLHPAP
ncbi:LysR family transcriptional regulator [Mesorhizobium sophorae]|uniref:LysR family transcriptional regulator n=1 Tax=Mesorhizobium sophorae TaxID=1300294 RepID=UPI000BA4B8D8|nr:LysR family transcriptional regulator [Mesorhizobium sophorae]